MVSELGLSGTELLVYALVYSFSRTGYFNGSRSYIAKRTGASLRSVDRALHSLVDKGYIIRILEGKDNKPSVYKAKMSVVAEAEEAERLDERQFADSHFADSQNDGGVVSFCRGGGVNLATDNKEIMKEINCLSSSSSAHAPTGTHTRGGTGLKYEVKSYGREGLVSLTEQQYEYLRGLVGSDLLAAYIRKLEIYMNTASDPPIRNHFKTLRRFIEDDYSLPPDAERDLRNRFG